MQTTAARCAYCLTVLGLCAALNACAVLSGLSTDERLLQADRDRALAQSAFRKSEISLQNETP